MEFRSFLVPFNGCFSSAYFLIIPLCFHQCICSPSSVAVFFEQLVVDVCAKSEKRRKQIAAAKSSFIYVCAEAKEVCAARDKETNFEEIPVARRERSEECALLTFLRRD